MEKPRRVRGRGSAAEPTAPRSIAHPLTKSSAQNENPATEGLRASILQLALKYIANLNKISNLKGTILMRINYEREDMASGSPPTRMNAITQRVAEKLQMEFEQDILREEIRAALGFWEEFKDDTERDGHVWNVSKALEGEDRKVLKANLTEETWYAQLMAVFDCGVSLRPHPLTDPDRLAKTIAEDRILRKGCGPCEPEGRPPREPSFYYSLSVKGVPLNNEKWSHEFDRIDLVNWSKVVGLPQQTIDIFQRVSHAARRDTLSMSPRQLHVPVGFPAADPASGLGPDVRPVIHHCWEEACSENSPSSFIPIEPVDNWLPGIRELQLPMPSLPVAPMPLVLFHKPWLPVAMPCVAPRPTLPRKRKRTEVEGDDDQAPGSPVQPLAKKVRKTRVPTSSALPLKQKRSESKEDKDQAPSSTLQTLPQKIVRNIRKSPRLLEKAQRDV